MEHKPPDGFYLYEPVVYPPATAVVSAEGQSCSDRQAARLDRIRAKELANHMRHDVISDVVLPYTAGDGRDIDMMAGDAAVAGTRPSPSQDAGGGVWEYLFPGEQQRGLRW